MQSADPIRDDKVSNMKEVDEKDGKFLADLLPADKVLSLPVDQLKSYLTTMDVELDFEKRPKKYYTDSYMQAIKDPRRKRKLVNRLRNEIESPVDENNIQRKRKRYEEDSGRILNNNQYDSNQVSAGRGYEQTSELQSRKSIVNTASNQNSRNRVTEESIKYEKASNQPTPKIRTNQIYLAKAGSIKSDMISAPRNEAATTGSNQISRQVSACIRNVSNANAIGPENESNTLDGSQRISKPNIPNRGINLAESIINTTIENVDIDKDNELLSSKASPVVRHDQNQSRLQEFLAKIKLHYPQTIKYIFATAGLGTLFIWLYRRLPVHLRGVNFYDPAQFGLIILALIGVISFFILLSVIKKNKDLETKERKLIADNCYNEIKQALMQKNQEGSRMHIEVIESEFIQEYCQANHCTVDDFRQNYLPYIKQFINEDDSMEEKVQYSEGELKTRWVLKE